MQIGRRGPLMIGLAVLCILAVITVGVLTVPGRLWWEQDQLRSEHLFDLSRRHAFVETLVRWIGYLTVPTVLRVISLIGVVLLWRRGRPGTAVWWTATVVVGGAVAIVVRYAVARPRPHWPGSGPPVEGYTFPSGHAMNAAVFAACVLVVAWPSLGRLGRAAGTVAGLLFVVAVGASRVVLGVHRVSDIVAAWLTAAAVLAVMLVLAGPIGRRVESSRIGSKSMIAR